MNDENHFERRFYLLNAIVTIILLIAVFISIKQFGTQAWESKISIGLVLSGGKDEQGWNREQYRGMKSACDELGYNLSVQENVSVTDNSRVVKELAEKGVRLIFLTNACTPEDLQTFIKQYPRIRFYTIESTFISSNVSQYSIRYIDLRYLSGVIAGIRTKTNIIGYVAPTPTAPVMQGINAFTLGVQRVNPFAQVLLIWTGSVDNPTNEEQAVNRLKAHNADVLSYFQSGNTVPMTAERVGIDFLSFHESYPDCKHFLGAITANWKLAYMDVLRRYRHQTYNNDYLETMTESAARLEPALNHLSTREKVFLESERWNITHGRIVFSGQIIDRNGVIRCNANESLGGQYLQKNMDWLVKGVTTIGN